MSTIIIITPGPKKQNKAEGNNVVDANGNVVATFNTPEQAIAYLQAVSPTE